jgi:biopolymer transport protein ExbD
MKSSALSVAAAILMALGCAHREPCRGDVDPASPTVRSAAAPNDSFEVPRDAVIDLDASGDLSLNGTPVTIDGLPGRLLDLRAGGKKPQVSIRASKSAPYGQVAEVIDCLKAHGHTARLSIRNKPN